MLHMKEDSPIWDEGFQMYENAKMRNYYIDSVTNFSPIGSGIESHSQCYSKCLRSKVGQNYQQFSYFASTNSEEFTHKKQECDIKCVGNKYTFFSGSVTKQYSTKNKTQIFINKKGYVQVVKKVEEESEREVVCVTYRFQTIQQIEEVLGYNFSQLVSDICSVIGITFGISCMTLWNKLFSVLSSRRNEVVHKARHDNY